jgi:predicted nucleic acid-binding Zn ribbon protein
MSRRAPRPLSAAISQLTASLAPASTLARVQEVWDAAAGAGVAAAARPVAERSGTLTLACEAAVWAQELELMSQELIGRINSELGAETITGLRCVTA